MHQLGQVLEMVYSPSGQGDCRGYMRRVGVFYIDGGNLLHRGISSVDGGSLVLGWVVSFCLLGILGEVFACEGFQG